MSTTIPSTELDGKASDAPPLGQPIRGPRALTDDWSRFWHLTYNIARNEFKLRFFGSVLGYVWQLMRPLLLFGVLYVFFTKVAQVNRLQGPANQFYGAQLLGSIVLFTFFAEAAGGSVRSVVDRENLVRKIQFPDWSSRSRSSSWPLFNLGLNLIVVTDLRADRRRSTDADMARAAADRGIHGRVEYGRRHAAVGPVRSLPRRAADLGRRSADPVLRVACDHLDCHRSGKAGYRRCSTSIC